MKLKLARELDRETRSQYDLTLIAWDGGQPPQSGSLAIVINVVDANDNSPIFTRPEYVVQLRESTPRGTAIVRVSATDLDTGLNGQVSDLGDRADWLAQARDLVVGNSCRMRVHTRLQIKNNLKYLKLQIDDITHHTISQ